MIPFSSFVLIEITNFDTLLETIVVVSLVTNLL